MKVWIITKVPVNAYSIYVCINYPLLPVLINNIYSICSCVICKQGQWRRKGNSREKTLILGNWVRSRMLFENHRTPNTFIVFSLHLIYVCNGHIKTVYVSHITKAMLRRNILKLKKLATKHRGHREKWTAKYVYLKITKHNY